MTTTTDRILSLEKWRTDHKAEHLKGVIHSHAAPVPPSSGTPALPPGATLIKDFADGTLAPFKVQTYPNLHPTEPQVQYGDFVTDAAHISIHDGYLDLRCTKPVAGSTRWKQSMVSTALEGTPYQSTLSLTAPVKLSFAARMNGGTGAWQAIWMMANVLNWSNPQEIDWAEVIGGRLTGNVHPNAAEFYALPMPDTSWHVITGDWQAAMVRALLDGVEVGRIARALPAPMGLLLDAKVGLTAPNASTPDLYLQVAKIWREP